jgi:hypothetical protein
VRYEPSGWRSLRRILCAEDVSPGDVFVDLGSGKGRVILEAAQYPFHHVIGVEIAPELTAGRRVGEQTLDPDVRVRAGLLLRQRR